MEPRLKYQYQTIEVVYEDEYCLVVNKPNNLIVHHSHFARNVEEVSLVEQLKENGYLSIFPIHRLDRKTSGIILFAKDKSFVADFQKLFEEGRIHKTYISLVRGYVSGLIKIDSPVKNERGNYKEALSWFKGVKFFEKEFDIPPYPKSRYSLVVMQPISGRTHQLRIHSNKISHPIIGDHKYGNRHHNHYFDENLKLPNLFLHAYKLRFTHPFTKNKIMIKASLPSFWSNFINS